MNARVAAADAPRFLPTLAKWLAGRGWEKPPPQGKAARGKGRRHKPKFSTSNAFFEEGGYRDTLRHAAGQLQGVVSDRAGSTQSMVRGMGRGID
jgi:hypothetical protein